MDVKHYPGRHRAFIQVAGITELDAEEAPAMQALDVSYTANVSQRLLSLRVHTDDDAISESEDLVVTLVPAIGTDYALLLLEQDLDGVTDLLWEPEQAIYLMPGDSLTFEYDNTAEATVSVVALMEVA